MRMFLALLLLCPAVLFAGETVLGEWDFSRGIQPVSGNFECVLREGTVLRNGGLDVTPGDDMIPCGLALRNAVPELMPKGTFRLSIRFSLARKGEKRYTQEMVLLDAKGLFMPEADRHGYDSGYAVTVLPQREEGWFRFRVYLGLQNGQSVFLSSHATEVETGKEHTLSFLFRPSGKSELLLDGTLLVERSLSTGSGIASSMQPMVIGDRGMPFYTPFAGTIYHVKIAEVTP